MTDKQKNIIALGVSTIFSLFLIEGILRFMEKEDYTLPIRLNDNGFVTHKFNIDKMRYDGENKKKVHIKTNGEGFIGPDYNVVKPSGTLRVAVFGDSFTEAMQVDYEKSFSYLLENRLNSEPPAGFTRAEVINFGTGGTGTGDAMLFYDTYARKYDPDVVILAFYVGNDVDDNSKYLPLRNQMLLGRSAWAEVRPPDAAARRSFVGFKDVVFRSSAIVRFLDRVVRSSTLFTNAARKVGLYRPTVVKDILDLTKYDYYYLVPPDPLHKEAIDYSYALINNFNREVKEDGKKFLVMFIPQGIAVHPDQYTEYVKDHPGLATSTYSPQNLEDTLVKGLDPSIPVLRLSTTFSKLINEDKKEMYLVGGKGHFNESAHPIVSDLLYKELIILTK
jgi:hypothetical protein